MKKFLHRFGDILIAATLLLPFVVWPALDLKAAALFYVPETGFPAREIWWIKVVYEGVARLWILALIFLFLYLGSYLSRYRAGWIGRRKALLYLIAALLIGPGLITNTILKDNWGRPRPIHLERFGGTDQFAPLLTPSTACDRNCSFPSGHASGGYFLMAGYWLTRRRRWLVSGIALGLFVGYTRMAMGGHFLSDILSSGIVVYFTCKALAGFFGLDAPDASDASVSGSAAGNRSTGPQV